MTRKHLRKIVRLVAICYLIIIISAVLLRAYDTSEEQIMYSTLKDLVPLFFALPLGYLGFCFSSRRAFIETNRKLWNQLVDVINDASHSTYKSSISEDEYRLILKNLAKSIDQVRASYENVGKSDHDIGKYPFEPVKQIYRDYRAMGFGEISAEKREEVRERITENWKSIRNEFLHEFDRHAPEKPVLDRV